MTLISLRLPRDRPGRESADRYPSGPRVSQSDAAPPLSDWLPRGRAHRVATLVAALSLLGVSFATWATVVQIPVNGAISVFGLAALLALIVAALVVGDDQLHRIDIALVGLGLLLLAGWATSSVYLQPGYGTDEAAFEQYAGSLLLHGHNPYGADLTPALSHFRVPIQYATYLLSGGVVHGLEYPSVPVLLAALFIPITGGVQSVIIANVVALAATCVVMFLLLPRTWKSLAVLVTIGLPILFGNTVAGVNAILMGLPLLIVAWKWTETGRAARLGRAGAVRAICLGLAASTQPLAWFIVPFVLVGTWRLRSAELGRRGAQRIVVAYTAIALAAFAVLNLPFIVWDPGAWSSGVSSPLTQHAIPYGQGIIDATLFFHTGGGSLFAYTVAGALFYLAALIAFAVWFDRLGMACFVLPVTALFFSTRSLAEYFMVLIAVWTVSLLTNRSSAFKLVQPLIRTRRPRAAAALLFIPALGALVAALASPPPLSLSVLSVRTNGELEGVWKLQVAVTNTSHHRLSPRFAVNYMGQATTFFHELAGPDSLAPGQHATYVLAAPNRGSMPGITTPFVVLATTTGPDTVSVSRRYVPEPYAADLEPGYVNEIIPLHRSITFQVQLRSPFGSRVRKSGVQVALGQVIYGQNTLYFAQASINGRAEGMTPVFASTDDRGIATFRITNSQPQELPIYFQAWIAGSYPYGYSAIIPTIWQSHR
jgi:uncharacterized membrane protein